MSTGVKEVEREEERKRIAGNDARHMLIAFIERYGDLEEFAAVTRAIDECLKVREG